MCCSGSCSCVKIKPEREDLAKIAEALELDPLEPQLLRRILDAIETLRMRQAHPV